MRNEEQTTQDVQEVEMERSAAVRAYRACMAYSREAEGKGLYMLAHTYKREALQLKRLYNL